MKLRNPSKYAFSIILFLMVVCYSYTQEKELTQDDYGFQIDDSNLTPPLPYGYEALKTYTLNTSLYKGKTYRVRFHVKASKSPKWNAYSYYFEIFPHNFINKYGIKNKGLTTSEDIFPVVKVSRIQNFEQQYLSFIVKPDTTYSHLTVSLKQQGNNYSRLREYVDVSGVFIKLLKDEDNQETEEDKEEIENNTSLNEERELIDTEETFTVKDKNVTISLYDHKSIDNDIVTIYLNDEIIVDNLTLKRKKKKIKAELKPGENTIRLHANNLGTIPPNTVAIIIKSGNQKIKQILTSDLDKSEYFTITYNKSKAE